MTDEIREAVEKERAAIIAYLVAREEKSRSLASAHPRDKHWLDERSIAYKSIANAIASGAHLRGKENDDG